MEHLVATAGLPRPPLHPRFDFGPPLVLLGTLAAMRFLFRMTMSWPVIGLGLLAGVALGWAVTVWGVVTPTAVALLLAAMAAGPVRRWQAGSAGRD
jgi:hypothetical protein